MLVLTRLIVVFMLIIRFLWVESWDGKDISSLPTLFETHELPIDESGNFLPRYMATIGNGHIATTIFTDAIFMNGLFNGFKGESHRAIIPSRNNIRLEVDKSKVANHTYALDVEKGMFFEKFTLGNFQVELRTFAHRYYHKIIVNQIDIKALSKDGVNFNQGSSGKLDIKLVHSVINSSVDIDFDAETEFESSISSKYTCGKTLQVEDPRYQSSLSMICIIRTEIPEKIEARADATFTLFASYDRTFQGASGDFNAVASLVSSGNHEEVYSKHVQAWARVWEDGRIEVEGNLELSKIIYGCLYYIISSLPITYETYSAVGQFHGLSPGSLAYGTAFNDFQGHSFWDTEIWIYPTVAYFYPEMAREILNYRLYGLRPARDRAKETNLLGARFAWEGGVTGAEVTPECCPQTRDFELHITGDIAFAIRQYIAVTRDLEWLKETQPHYIANGCGLLRDIAEFWVSRAKYNRATRNHDINDISSPGSDQLGVNNNGYTNVIAGYSVFFAKYAECLCNGSMDPMPEKWMNIAKSLKFLYDDHINYHPEFEGYSPGDVVKQADVVLLGFPLMYPMDLETRKNDVNMYEKVTRSSGPGMTYSMHTVGILEYDEVDRAEAVFNRSYQSYMREPYKVWSESQPPTLGAINYITGMGGFLQAIVNGFGGYRLYPEKIVFIKPRVLPHSKSLKLCGLNFLENSFDVLIEPDKVTITLKTISNKYFISIESENMTYEFGTGKNVLTLPNSEPPIPFTIKATASNCPLPFDLINMKYQGSNTGYSRFVESNAEPLTWVIFMLSFLYANRSQL